MGSRRVVVVGAGFTGLLSARRAAQAGHDVLVLEASERLGGQIHTVDFAGMRVDVGAEAFHTGVPSVMPFLTEMGMAEEVETAVAAGTWIATRQGLTKLPAGVGPAGPTKIRPVVESRMMSMAGMARAGLEPAHARLDPRLAPGADVSVGAFVTSRFGAEVTELFVDPLLGGLHAGDVNSLSLRACTPMLAPAAQQGRSLLLKRPPRPGGSAGKAGPAGPGGRPTGAPALMTFVTPPGGLDTVLTRLTENVSPPQVRTSAKVTRIRRLAPEEVSGSNGFAVAVEYRSGDGTAHEERCDGVVLAVPPPVAAGLLKETVPEAFIPLQGVGFATVATTLLAFRREDVAGVGALSGTGILVPSTHGRLMKAATFLSTKWRHLGGGDTFVLRLSAGRAGQSRVQSLSDDDLVAGVRADLAELTGLRAEPTDVRVTRWNSTMPQMTVGHLSRLATARKGIEAAQMPVALAGTGYDGVGLSTCITSATNAAAHLDTLFSGGTAS